MAATRRSWSGSGTSGAGRSRPTRRRARGSRRRPRARDASSSGTRTAPVAVSRSGTSKQRWRGTSGRGFWNCRSYSDGRIWRAISSMSRKPPVVTNAVRAVVPSMTALVATVRAVHDRPRPRADRPAGVRAIRRSMHVHEPDRRVGRRRRQLRDPRVARIASSTRTRVGERAADVDAEAVARLGGAARASGRSPAVLVAAGRRGRAGRRRRPDRPSRRRVDHHAVRRAARADG